MLQTYRKYLNQLTDDQLEQEAVIYWGIDDMICGDEEARQELIELLVAKDEESEHGH